MDDFDRIGPAFFPMASEAEMKAAADNQRFAHYTSARVAMSIIRNQEIWMRKAYVMNDYSEVAHGAQMLLDAWSSELGVRFRAVVEAGHSGLIDEVVEIFDAWLDQSAHSTYITCFSRHKAEEDLSGRLSMWRAYGGATGVALVFNGAAFGRKENNVNVFTSPVAYLDSDSFDTEFRRTVEVLEACSADIGRAERSVVLELAVRFLVFTSVAVKNPGFAEEREWRAIHATTIWRSTVVTPEIELIGDRPQKVFKIPLDGASEGNEWLNLRDILDRVIIGPGPEQDVVGEAMFELLRGIGLDIADAKSRVVLSNTPLRG